MTGPHTGSLDGAGHKTFAEGALRLARDMVEDVQRLLVSSAGSMAELSGLVPGDVVLSVNGISGLSNFQASSIELVAL